MMELKMADVTCYSTGKFTCRFCGKTDFSIDIFSEHGRRMEVSKKTFFSLGIHLLETDKLPHYICFYCFGKLMDYYMFKQNVLLVQKRLTDDILRNNGDSNGVLIVNDDECVIDVTDDPPEKTAKINSPKKDSKVDSVVPGPSVVPSPSTSSPAKTNNKRQNSCPPSTPNKKDRKTVCLDCGKWLSRSEVPSHEATVHFRRNFDCLLCNTKFDTYLLYKEHSCIRSEK